MRQPPSLMSEGLLAYLLGTPAVVLAALGGRPLGPIAPLGADALGALELGLDP